MKVREAQRDLIEFVSLIRLAGIWTKHLKAKTNLHQTIIDRCLKTLTQKKLIKRVPSVQVRFFKRGDPCFSQTRLSVCDQEDLYARRHRTIDRAHRGTVVYR